MAYAHPLGASRSLQTTLQPNVFTCLFFFFLSTAPEQDVLQELAVKT